MNRKSLKKLTTIILKCWNKHKSKENVSSSKIQQPVMNQPTASVQGLTTRHHVKTGITFGMILAVQNVDTAGPLVAAVAAAAAA